VGIDYDFHLNFDDITARLLEHAPAAIALGLEHIHTVVTPLVPVETGNLVGSGGVTAAGLQGEILYPGPYARYQHEGVYYRHGRFGAPLTHTHGESFFLARPMVSEADTAIRIVADELWRWL
jgi:hypothetical protein